MPRTRASSVGGVPHFRRYIEKAGHYLPTSAGQATTNQTCFTPFDIKIPLTVDGIVICHGTPNVGNYYVAFYSSLNESPTTRLAVSILTATNGINMKQFVPFITPVSIQIGYYFGAVVKSAFGDINRAAFNDYTLNPAGVADGPSLYIQDLGAFIAPTLNAVPVQTFNFHETFWGLLRVSSIP